MVKKNQNNNIKKGRKVENIKKLLDTGRCTTAICFRPTALY